MKPRTRLARPPRRIAGLPARVGAAVAFAVALAMPGPCGARSVDRAELEAAIVYNILMFVDWPADAAPPAGAPLVLCVDGASPLASPLKSLAGRPVRNWSLELRELAAGDAAVRRCHAVFVDAAPPDKLPVRRDLKGAAVLVISDGPRAAADEPSAIRLEEVGGRIAFDVDLAAVRRARLQISSRLLRLARKVSE